MTVQMIGRELDEIVRELYVLPPNDFVAARNELVRQARAAGSPEVANRLQGLRRPTRSAWLVNLLARDTAAMQRLSALGRQLRDAQTGLSRTELRSLAEQRRQLIAELIDRTRTHAAQADLPLTPTVLSEVEATLQAALVDLAGALTIRNGRLVRPLAHIGFGPRPRAAVRRIAASGEHRPTEAPDDAVSESGPDSVPESGRAPVEDELAARRRRNSADRLTIEVLEGHDRGSAAPGPSAAPGTEAAPGPAIETEPQTVQDLRLAEEELADAEAAHWQSEFELADAEAAVESADDMLSTLDTRRIEARRDKVTAQRHLAEAQAQQRQAVNALADARQRLDAARRRAGQDS
jgi:hypothetical protein